MSKFVSFMWFCAWEAFFISFVWILEVFIMEADTKRLGYGLKTLVIFRNLLSDRVVSSLSEILGSDKLSTGEKLSLYGELVSELYSVSEDLSHYLLDLVLKDVNPYVLMRASGKEPGTNMEKCLCAELRLFQSISLLTPDDLRKGLDWDGYLPGWDNSEIDFVSEYLRHMDEIGLHGYGIFSEYHMFVLDRSGSIIPVGNPDRIRLSELFEYERERQQVIDNTLALLSGAPAQNVLLYGDAGTGKSSTVKALVNEYSERGLRLVEVKKEQIDLIPHLIETLSSNPLKFIIFIDDLSFSQDNDSFGSLKAALEGSVSARTGNIAIYATSNRRKLVRERFSDRDGDDIHRNDTIQELNSLSDRFGLTVSFIRPSKKVYLEIVSRLAHSNNIDIDEERLFSMAEQYALAANGRSGRTARHFIDHLLGVAELPGKSQTDACG